MTTELWIWAVTLGVVTFVVVPVAVYLLRHALRMARGIERYAFESLQASEGIAHHTAAIVALEETIRTASSVLEATKLLRERTGAIAEKVGGKS